MHNWNINEKVKNRCVIIFIENMQPNKYLPVNVNNKQKCIL